MVQDGERADAELVALSVRGTLGARQEAFSLLVTRYEGLVRAMLLNLCRNRALADDLSQDTFLQAWQKLATLSQPEKFCPWLKQLAYRRFLHHYRRSKVERKHAQLDQPEISIEMAVDDALEALLALCSPMERELMILCYAFEFTHAEIGAARGMATGTVKSHVHRAKQKMRALIERQHEGRNTENSNG